MRVKGGAERCHSVLNAVATLAGRARERDWILVHDAARPCLRAADLDRLIETLREDPVGGLLGVPVRDTMKRDDGDRRVPSTVHRASLWHAYTPQMFRLGLLRQALQAALAANDLVTDDASAIERWATLRAWSRDTRTISRSPGPRIFPWPHFYLRQQGRIA